MVNTFFSRELKKAGYLELSGAGFAIQTGPGQQVTQLQFFFPGLVPLDETKQTMRCKGHSISHSLLIAAARFSWYHVKPLKNVWYLPWETQAFPKTPTANALLKIPAFFRVLLGKPIGFPLQIPPFLVEGRHHALKKKGFVYPLLQIPGLVSVGIMSTLYKKEGIYHGKPIGFPKNTMKKRVFGVGGSFVIQHP